MATAKVLSRVCRRGVEVGLLDGWIAALAGRQQEASFHVARLSGVICRGSGSFRCSLGSWCLARTGVLWSSRRAEAVVARSVSGLEAEGSGAQWKRKGAKSINKGRASGLGGSRSGYEFGPKDVICGSEKIPGAF